MCVCVYVCVCVCVCVCVWLRGLFFVPCGLVPTVLYDHVLKETNCVSVALFQLTMTADTAWQDAYRDVNSIQFQTFSQSVESEVSYLDPLCLS